MMTAADVVKLYVATFNRAPDTDGLDYWLYDSGLNLDQIAQSFFDQSEMQLLYPAQMPTRDKVIEAYDNLFNRTPDTAGLNYWIEQIDSGVISQSSMLIALINGALNDDAVILENKTDIGLYFVESALNNTTWAAAVMNEIDSTQQSVIDAKQQIDRYVAPLYTDASAFSQSDLDIGGVSSSETIGVAPLMSGYAWDQNIITYSFNTSIPSWYYTSAFATEVTNQWAPFSLEMRSAVDAISSGLNELINAELRYVNSYGDIRYNVVESEWGGFAFFPMDTNEIDGDVFVTSDFLTEPDIYTLESGGNGWMTIAHELGHAMGLKHPFEDGEILPESLDDVVHTIMSYTDYRNYAIEPYMDQNGVIQFNYVYVNPALYGLYDIAALQTIYGANLSTRTGDDRYTISIDTPEYITIWDAGGEDSIECSNATGACTVSLMDGTLNSLDVHTLTDQIDALRMWAHQNGDTHSDLYIADIFNEISSALYTGENNLAIAHGVIIENVFTGSGDDTIWDNAVDNAISSGAGDDTIYLGAGGWDTIDGGEGYDTLYLDMTLSAASWSFVSENYYRLIGNDFAAELIGIETVRFSDTAVHQIADLV